MRLFALLLALGSAGCATIITGTTKAVNVTSEPEGAIVSIQGKQVRTPGTILLSRGWGGDGSGYIRHEGASAPIKVDAEFEGWIVGNVIFGGVIGILVDLATGSCRDYPDAVHFELVDGAWALGSSDVMLMAAGEVDGFGAPPSPGGQKAAAAMALAQFGDQHETRNPTKPAPGWARRNGEVVARGWVWTAEARVPGRFAWEPLRFLWTGRDAHWARVKPAEGALEIGEFEVLP